DGLFALEVRQLVGLAVAGLKREVGRLVADLELDRAAGRLRLHRRRHRRRPDRESGQGHQKAHQSLLKRLMLLRKPARQENTARSLAAKFTSAQPPTATRL